MPTADERIAMAQLADRAAESASRPQETHPYQFTITGRCLRCQRVEADHIKMAAMPAKNECSVDHNSITIRRLIGDEGESWTTCPQCHVQLEPNPPDVPIKGARKQYGPGRLPFTQRHWDRMSTIKALFENGYYKS